jgi:hypothetical protein
MRVPSSVQDFAFPEASKQIIDNDKRGNPGSLHRQAGYSPHSVLAVR